MTQTRGQGRREDAATQSPGALAAGPPKSVEALDYDVLAHHLGYLIRRLQVSIFQDFIRTLAAADIRPAQYSVLVVIGANPGLSQITLSQALGIERARLVRVLDELQRRRLVERRPAASDRRSHALHLSMQGEALLVHAKALAASHERNVRNRLGGERWHALLSLLSDSPMQNGGREAPNDE